MGDCVKERGILFSDEMVRAILDGRKTQTRRPVKPQPLGIGTMNAAGQYCQPDREGVMPGGWRIESPFGSPGDLLWVREAFCGGQHGTPYLYRASWQQNDFMRWRPSIHMPRWASRITLEVKAVRVERVQEISSRDAWAEGFRCSCTRPVPICAGNIVAFRETWNSIYAPNGLGWDKNPWVWVVEFERVAR